MLGKANKELCLPYAEPVNIFDISRGRFRFAFREVRVDRTQALEAERGRIMRNARHRSGAGYSDMVEPFDRYDHITGLLESRSTYVKQREFVVKIGSKVWFRPIPDLLPLISAKNTA